MASFQDIIAAHEMFARGKPGGCKAFFRFATLRKIVLQRRNLEDIQFIGCDLRLARLALSNFRFASFYGSKLDQADFRGCDLTRADMRGVSLQGAQLYAARMDEADFRRASLVEIDDDERWQYRTADNGKAGGFVPSVVDFRDCSMRGARLNGAKLQGADFSGAILEGADLSGANLLDASFDDAVLTDVDLENTILSPDALQGALWAPSPEACVMPLQRMPIGCERQGVRAQKPYWMVKISAFWAPASRALSWAGLPCELPVRSVRIFPVLQWSARISTVPICAMPTSRTRTFAAVPSGTAILRMPGSTAPI